MQLYCGFASIPRHSHTQKQDILKKKNKEIERNNLQLRGVFCQISWKAIILTMPIDLMSNANSKAVQFDNS